ncbi:transcriptional activator of glycolytic enzymes-domain-containing protein [Lipomyces tetrasporus]|uniref:Transcriptional activator of glycolytic enzymes-domain-containing protein n=1 Tax=Lipomyces tetrasporus TaxID=54092 RepID=A0AAD7QU66_9ASCO|nr:transcriptional activator of glycolytic enzymes-domain-containing protein [Lipomyces tetrasporus]KAJ8101031.1 transcriptional activator of glycolytic enzymes-domain-containing protein [Lipomyces tetrasporus]
MADYRSFDDSLAGVVVTGSGGPGGSSNPRTTLLSQAYSTGSQHRSAQQQQQHDPQIEKIQKSLDQLHSKVDALQHMIEQRVSAESVSRNTATYLNTLLDRQRRGLSAALQGNVQTGLAVDPDVGGPGATHGILSASDVEMHDPRLMTLQSNDLRTVGHGDSTGSGILSDAMDSVVGQQSSDVSQRGSNGGTGPNNHAAGNNGGNVGPTPNAMPTNSQLNNNMIISIARGQSASAPVAPVRNNNSRRRNSSHIGAQYKMDRATQSVDRFWEEWTVGINGSPSIQALNATFRASWRSEVAERKFYSQRLVLVRTIEWMARTRHIAVNEAVDELEKRRRNENISLSRLCRILKEEETKRGE